MTVIQRSTSINAPIEKVFGVIDTPETVPDWAAGVTRVGDIVKTEGRVGDTMSATYSALGIPFSMKWTLVEYEKPKKLASSMEGRFTGTFSYTLESEGDATRVSWHIDYTPMWGVVGQILDALMLKSQNESNSERMLENLKNLCESG